MITYNRFINPEQVKRLCPRIDSNKIEEAISYFALLEVAAILVRMRFARQENEALDKIEALWESFRESVEVGKHEAIQAEAGNQ